MSGLWRRNHIDTSVRLALYSVSDIVYYCSWEQHGRCENKGTHFFFDNEAPVDTDGIPHGVFVICEAHLCEFIQDYNKLFETGKMRELNPNEAIIYALMSV
jgi:hypothetical protein